MCLRIAFASLFSNRFFNSFGFFFLQSEQHQLPGEKTISEVSVSHPFSNGHKPGIITNGFSSNLPKHSLQQPPFVSTNKYPYQGYAVAEYQINISENENRRSSVAVDQSRVDCQNLNQNIVSYHNINQSPALHHSIDQLHASFHPIDQSHASFHHTNQSPNTGYNTPNSNVLGSSTLPIAFHMRNGNPLPPSPAPHPHPSPSSSLKEHLLRGTRHSNTIPRTDQTQYKTPLQKQYTTPYQSQYTTTPPQYILPPNPHEIQGAATHV